MKLGFFRKMKLVNVIVCLAFCLNLGFSGSALASEKISMLRPKSASDRVESAVLSMGIAMIQELNRQGPKALKVKLADLALDRVTDPVEQELIRNGIGVFQREGKTYVVCLIDNGWKVDLSKHKIEIEPFASVEERDAFISGGQLTWLAGNYAPEEIIDAQAATKAYLEKAGTEGRIFREDNLGKRVAQYSATRTSVARQLPPLDKKAQAALVKRLETAFAFRRGAINSTTQGDIDSMMAIGLSPDSMVKVGAETFSLEGGAAVGPITLDHLKEIGVGDSLIGHSATRYTELYKKNPDGTFEQVGIQKGDTDLEVREKIRQALQNKMKITLCVGETLKIREADKNAVGFVFGQLEEDLDKFNLSGEQVLGLLEAVAYEPLWAIGTGVAAKEEQIQEMLAAIRKWFVDKYGEDVAKKIALLYGGSVSAENAEKTFALPDCDGALIAGASLKADSFAKIAQIADATGKKMRVFANWKAYEFAKRDILEQHLKALASVNLKNTAINYYLPFTLLKEAQDLVSKARSPKITEVMQDLGNPKRVNTAVILDEENNPSFYYKGEPGSSKWSAVTASSGGFKYPVYDFEEAEGKAPRSIYKILAMEESYMEMAKTNPEALLAYRLKQLHEYFEVSENIKFHRQESTAVKNLIDKYDKTALDMWKKREADKAKAKLEQENKKVVLEVTIANIAKFLDPKLEEVIPAELIEVAKQESQNLVGSGLLTDYQIKASAGDIGIISTRKNRNAVEHDALVPAAMVNVFLKVLNKAKEMGIYKGEDLLQKSYLEQARALEIRRPYVPLKYTERAADPFGVLWASNTYAGAFNLLIWEMLSNPMYFAGGTIDPTAIGGFMFEVWDSVEDEIYRFDGETENTKLRALANQPGRYAIVAVYPKTERKVAADEPVVIVTVKRIADDGKTQVGDFSPVMVVRSQSSLPAWGEYIAPAGTIMPLITYGGDKTRGIVALRPTNIEEANKIPASRRQGLSIFTGFGFQSHDNGYFGISEDIGGHQTMAPARENAEKWARLFFGGVSTSAIPRGVPVFATLDDVDVGGKTVLVRPDINVPAENRHIRDPQKPHARVVEAAKTLKELAEKNAKVVVVFHQGRPGDPDFMDTPDEHAAQLSRIIGRPIKTVNDLYGEEAIAAIKALKPGEILFLKPVRAADPANPKNTLENNPLFIARLKSVVDLVVLDGFSVAHRDSPSVTGFHGIPAVAGRLMERELKGAVNLFNPPQPHLVVVGGGKVTEKLTEMFSSLESGKATKVVVGGRLANLALIAAQPEAATAKTPEAQYQLAVATVGEATADDLKEFLGEIPRLAQLIAKYRDKIELPPDMAYLEGETRHVVNLVNGRVPPQGFNYLLSGIGPETAQRYAAVASRTDNPFASAFVIGPLSDSRYATLQEETRTVLEAVSKLKFWSTGGGDTEDLVRQLGFTPTYSSLAGGALAEFKAGKELPGVKFLEDNYPDLYALPKWMDHITKLEPFLRPHTYNRDDAVFKTRQRLDSRFQRNPVLKDGESDPLLQARGDYARSNIKADIGSVPGHYKPHRVTIRALVDILEIARSYGFKGVNQFLNLTRAITILRTGLTIDEIVSKNGLYRKGDSEALMKKVNEFRQKTKITNWDEALAYIKGKTKDESLIALVTSLRDAQIDYGEFTKKVVVDSMADALNYFVISEEKASPERLEVLSIMNGLTASSAKNMFDTNEAIRKALGLTTDLAEDEKILDFKVWSAGDDCQLTMDHKRLAEDKLVHSLAWDALWYAADQTSYFKPYGWKQDILVDRLVSGNIQGAGPGYAEVQVRNGETVLVFSGDKCAPGAFTVPILGITRKARAEGKFKNGLIYEVWDINNKPRIFFYSEFPQDMEDMLTLLSSPEEFAIKRVWEAKKKWDGKEPIENVLDDIPLISASTERLVLTAGLYVGKDDPTFLVRITKGGLTTEEVIDIFQYPQVTLGFMRGSHVGPLVPGTQPSFFFGKDKPQEFKPEATPHLFDGPPPLTGLVLAAGKPLNEAKDVFEGVPWLNDAIKQGSFITQVLRRQGWAPPHKVEGPDTEYTTFPEVMEALQAEGRGRPGGNAQETQFYRSLLALQSEGISHKLSDAVIGVAKDAANKKVVLISSRVLRSDPSLILALQSINEQINQNLGVFGSTANIEANAYKFILVVDEPALKTTQDVEKLFAEIARVTHNGVKVNKDIFAQILTPDDMYEGNISDAASLLKQLKRMGISEELVAGLVGSKEWTAGLKAQKDISKDVVSVAVEAKVNEVVFAANALFGAVEVIAATDKQITDSLAKKLELVQEATSITVEPKEISRDVEDVFTAYRETMKP